LIRDKFEARNPKSETNSSVQNKKENPKLRRGNKGPGWLREKSEAPNWKIEISLADRNKSK
jgi:hypothetical protein